MDDLAVDGLKVSDESTYGRDGSVTRVRVYRFFIGKHGMFVERVPLENFDEFEIQRRVDKLRAHLLSPIR